MAYYVPPTPTHPTPISLPSSVLSFDMKMADASSSVELSSQADLVFHPRLVVHPPSSSTIGSSVPPSRPKRRQVKNACVNCQKACKKCDDSRPCLRCTRYGITGGCVDSVRKERKKGFKRGPYRKRGDVAAATSTQGSTILPQGTFVPPAPALSPFSEVELPPPSPMAPNLYPRGEHPEHRHPQSRQEFQSSPISIPAERSSIVNGHLVYHPHGYPPRRHHQLRSSLQFPLGVNITRSPISTNNNHSFGDHPSCLAISSFTPFRDATPSSLASSSPTLPPFMLGQPPEPPTRRTTGITQELFGTPSTWLNGEYYNSSPSRFHSYGHPDVHHSAQDFKL